MIDPRPTRHRAAPAERRRILREKVYGKPCRGCGAYHRPNGHHLLGGAYKEDGVDLIVMLGGSGSTGCHGIYTSRHRGADCIGRIRDWEQVAAAVRDTLERPENAAERAAIVARVGEVGLDRRYPKRRVHAQRTTR